MANEQISQKEFIIQAVTEAARTAIQTMAMAGTSRQEYCRTQDEHFYHETTYIQLEHRRQI